MTGDHAMTDYPADTVSALLARGAGQAAGHRRARPPWLTYGALRALARRTVGDLNAHGHRPRRPGGAGAAERAGGRVRIRDDRLRRHHGAAEPRLQGRRICLLPERPERPRPGRAGRHGNPGPRGRGGSGAFRWSSWCPRRTVRPAPSRCCRRPAWSARRHSRARRKPRTSRWSCTPPAPPRVRRSCRCAHVNVTASAYQYRRHSGADRRTMSASTSCRCSISTA